VKEQGGECYRIRAVAGYWLLVEGTSSRELTFNQQHSNQQPRYGRRLNFS
jgi:hypothetical protein